MRTSASQLKAKLGQYMRAVREGKEVVVTDRDKPVARLSPYKKPQREPIIVVSIPRDPSAPPLGAVTVRGIRPRNIDTTAILREDRDRR